VALGGVGTLVSDVLMQIVKTVDGNYQGAIIFRCRDASIFSPNPEKLRLLA
jgi:hypothetical protein